MMAASPGLPGLFLGCKCLQGFQWRDGGRNIRAPVSGSAGSLCRTQGIAGGDMPQGRIHHLARRAAGDDLAVVDAAERVVRAVAQAALQQSRALRDVQVANTLPGLSASGAVQRSQSGSQAAWSAAVMGRIFNVLIKCSLRGFQGSIRAASSRSRNSTVSRSGR